MRLGRRLRPQPYSQINQHSQEGASFSMVRIRLRRVGLKNQPSYRIVIQDKESPRDGRFIEIVGFYNPRTEPATISLDEAKTYDWMVKGAQPTESVAALFRTTGTLDRFARFKKGEPVETLVAEAAAAEAKRNTTGKTRKD
jgi:small subunit ribosomal protein S16